MVNEREDIDIEYLSHFWDLPSKDMPPVIEQTIAMQRSTFYVKLLTDMFERKKEQEKKEQEKNELS